MRQITWATLGAPDDGVHQARRRYTKGLNFSLHGHDFAEICWVESGSVVHVTDRDRQTLDTGAVVLVEPGHVHGLAATDYGGQIVNLAFPARVLADWRQRYGNDPAWPWPAAPSPVLAHLSPRGLATCGSLVQAGVTAIGPLARDRLLLSVLDQLRRPTTAWAKAPAWLASALDELANDHAALANGLPALVARCGRSREHVARVCRASCGRRAIDLVNDLRVEALARLLSQSDAPVGTLAAQVGLGSRTWCQQRFMARFGTTPAAWRRGDGRVVG